MAASTGPRKPAVKTAKKTAARKRSPKKPAIRKDSPKMSNSDAAESLVESLRSTDRIGPLDIAYVEAVRNLARAVDAVPDSPQLWGQYRAAVETLLGRVENGTDEISDLLARLSAADRD